jgi:aryl-alcohol dehydrogenase-like predicted oxidoreductase
VDERATAAGTAAYREGIGERVAAGHFRTLDGLVVSSIGLGTYLGDETDAADRDYGQAIVDAANLGCNLFDAAINYRAQRSERVLGQALAALGQLGLHREQLVVCTKGGYLPFDGSVPVDPLQYCHETYVRTGILRAEDVAGGAHAMTPRFLDDQIGRSRRNLGLDCIDLYYLHNPETQLGAVARTEFTSRIRTAFEALESQVSAGRIVRYGVATWNGFRRPPEAPDHLSLQALVRAAESVAGADHHFRAIQLPYNLAMHEAYAATTQVVDGERVTVIEAAARLGVAVVTSAALLQGQFARRLPQAVVDAFPGLDTAAQRALQFARSTPGVTAALVGMGSRGHVAENLRVAAAVPAPTGVASLFRVGDGDPHHPGLHAPRRHRRDRPGRRHAGRQGQRPHRGLRHHR